MLSSPVWIGVSADDEFLLLVKLDLDPGAGAFSGLIFGTAALTDQTFES